MQGWAIIVVALAVGLAVHFAWQAHDLRRVLKQYAGAKVARVAPAEATGATGKRTETSVIFTDMRGFTSISEKLTPERVALLLKIVLSPTLEVIRKNGGEVDKIQGDAILYRHADAEKALEMIEKVQQALEKAGEKARRVVGEAPQFYSGVHSGPVYLGFLGATGGYVDYTVVGDAVNVAARLQGLAAKYGVKAVISGNVYRMAGRPKDWRLLDVVQVKGRTEPIDIYTKPLDLGAWVEFEKAREMYVAGDFVGAEAAFRAAGFGLWAGRCRQLAADKPERWRGVWNWTAK
ncbi:MULTISPECIES: adenylate/guanylate cyclase domain-containing protein [Desulfovibrio]|uniref:Adenylate cyclase, class 3 n=1 Tax=Desulfovibrio desulfuricans TaxID=876 RepID=A0AA94HUM3_DESDE|nr:MULTISPECIES: adenylate/guanylate cyclase domain-containing protein [Desulfovibrio]ATD81375.1 adenylate/guanylate cyclase domain-containing protein [Desulfovibrio sp. G11]SFW67441.1 Adenylate cyclase, class 3 [Desulfovibrio desulfuricans]SPD37030.1 Adenylyl cyclase class-3/4/guanylyl cyclase [Desulfovibrio sp. G11]